MAVETLADVRSFNDYMRSKLLARVQSCPPEMHAFQPAPGKWSLQQHLEHLALAEEAYIVWLTRMVDEGREKGLNGKPKLVDAVPALVAMGDGPLEAPEKMLPAGTVPVETAVGRLEASRAQVNGFYDLLVGLETDQITIPFRTTRLNAAQVMHLIGIHELRHARHVAALVEAWESRS